MQARAVSCYRLVAAISSMVPPPVRRPRNTVTSSKLVWVMICGQLPAGVLACSGEPIEQEPDTKQRGPHDRVLPAADIADEQRPLGNEDPAHLSQCVSLHGTRKVVKDQRTDDTVDGAVGEWNRIVVKIARPAAGT